jgi:hypothetical protein
MAAKNVSTVPKSAAKRRPPGGSRKGIPNKATQEFRQTVQKLLDDNRENVTLWMEKVGKKSPAKALELIAKLAEFAAPKLARHEHTGDGGGPVVIQATPHDERL